MIGLSGLLPVPVVSVITGEAAGSAGIALSVADRILMQEHAIFTVSGGEGTDRRAAEPLAVSRLLTAAECVRLGVVDAVVSEPDPGAHVDVGAAARLLGAAIAEALADQRRPRRSPNAARS